MSATRFQIRTEGGRSHFRPGETLDGTVSWQVAGRPESVELRLFYHTVGKGTTDVEIVETAAFPHPAANGQAGFSFVLPTHPPSFSGMLVSLVWALELVVDGGDGGGSASEPHPIVVSPTGSEIDLYAHAENVPVDTFAAAKQRLREGSR